MKKLIFVMLLSTFALTACGGSQASVVNLNPNEFESKIQSSSVTVLDVRTPSEFASGHLPGAINIDFEAINFTSQIQNLNKTKTYAVYCHSGRRSGLATAQMSQSGFKSIYNLIGGVMNWTNSGKELVSK